MNWQDIIDKGDELSEEQLRKLARMNPNWRKEILDLLDKKKKDH